MPHILGLWSSLKGMPVNIWLVAFSRFINRCGSMVPTYITLYVMSKFSLGPARASYILLAISIGTISASVCAAWILKYLRPLWVMRLSVLLSGSTLIIFPFVNDFSILLLMGIFWGMVADSYQPANMLFLTKSVMPTRRKNAYTLNRMAANLGISIGPAVGGFIFMVNHDLIFWVSGTICFISVIVIFMVHSTPVSIAPKVIKKTTEYTRSFWFHWLYSLTDRRLFYVLLIGICVQIVFSQLRTSLPFTFIHDLNLPVYTIGLVLTLNTLMIVLFEVKITEITASQQNRRMIGLGAALVAIGFGMIGILGFGAKYLGDWLGLEFIWSSSIFGDLHFSATMALIAIAIVCTTIIWSLGEMLISPSLPTYVSDIAPEKQSHIYVSWYFTHFGIGSFLAPWIGGFFYEHFGGFHVWWIFLIIGLLGAKMSIFLKNPPHKNRRHTISAYMLRRMFKS